MSERMIDPGPSRWFRPDAKAGIGVRWIAVLLTAALTGLGILTEHTVRESLYDMLATTLNANLEANLNSLNMWLSLEQSEVQSWAQAEQVRENVAGLIQVAGDRLGEEPEALRTSSLQARAGDTTHGEQRHPSTKPQAAQDRP